MRGRSPWGAGGELTIVHPVEWPNFVRASRKRMLSVPKYALEIVYLVLRRVGNKARHRWSGGNHRGAKVWPDWLGDGSLDVTAGSEPLCFPAYTMGGPEVPDCTALSAAFDRGHDDPESYFAGHRWRHCLSAVIEGNESARLAVQKTLNWIQLSPPKSDRAWEPYSSCERVVNLAVLLAARPECRELIAERIVRDFFADSLEWINGHLEYYGTERTNNHILNNARALVVAGVVLRSDTAVERGLVIFARMAPGLFQADGFLRERSSHYQVVVTGWLLDAVHFARGVQFRSDVALRALDSLEQLSSRVAGATSLLLSYLGASRTHIGDISPDVHPRLSMERLRYLYSSSMTSVPEEMSGRRDDWIFVSNGKQALVTCLVPRSYPVDYNTHGHSDLGSFVWLVQGSPVLVDAGRSRYLTGATSFFQSGPAGHNTILINGLAPLAESLFLNGHWCPTPYSSATVRSEANGHVGFSVSHDGFSRIDHIGEHVRSVCFQGDTLVVDDQVDGSGKVRLETLWHFPPHFALTSKNTAVATGAGMLVSSSSAALDGQVPDLRRETYPFSEAYGDEQVAPMLRLVWSVSLPCSVRTILSVTPCAA